MFLEGRGEAYTAIQPALQPHIDLAVERRLESEYWEPIISKNRAEVIAECRASGRGTAWMAPA